MIRRSRMPLAALLLLVSFVVACTDRPAPTAPELRMKRGASSVVGTCTTIGALTDLVNAVFGAGSPNAQSALGKLSSMEKKVQKGDLVGAQDAARNLIRFLLEKASTLPGEEQVPQLIASLECYSGITNDSFLVYPSDQEQTLVNSEGNAGILLPPNPVTEPTLITVTLLPDTSTGVLDTKLDKYPGFVQITQSSGVVNSLTDSVVVAVCPASWVPINVLNRLRLGHQASDGFEIAPPADASFLDCAPAGAIASAASRLPDWAQSLVRFVMPQPLYANSVAYFNGGVGGTVTEFSPFGPVDPELSFSGGVGGTVTEFLRVPATPDTSTAPSSKTGRKSPKPAPKAPMLGQARLVVSGSQASLTAPEDCDVGVVGTSLPAECRPQVTITTASGTILQGVPVSWAIGLGGGTTAIDDPTTRVCGSFGSSASTATNANGKAGACWTLGAEAGTNTLVATATAGGDAPEGVYFTPASSTFEVTALKSAATLSLSGLAQTYTGSPIEVTVTTDPVGLSGVTVTYDGSSTAPTGAGSYAVVATLDHPSFEGAVTGTLVIGAAEQIPLTIDGPASASYGDEPMQLSTSGGSGNGGVTYDDGSSTACAVTAGGLLTITSGTGSCSVTATKATDGNYEAVSSAPFAVSPVKAGASISLSGLSFTYDGNAKSATVSTTPENLTAVTVTYDGSATLPVQAGSYVVVATLSNADYEAPSESGTLVIGQAAQAALAVVGENSVSYGGGAVTLSTNGGSGGGSVTYDAGASTACTVTAGGAVSATSGTGSCSITATKAEDRNYFVVSSAPFVLSVSKAAATMTLSGLAQTFTGSPIEVAVATAPIGLSGVTITYNGSPTAPTNAGSYPIVATLTNADYAAAPASGTLVIARADQSALILSAPASATYGAGTVQLSTTGGNAGLVTYASLTPASCSVVATSGVVTIATGVGTCDVSASRAGDGNYNPVTSDPASIALNRANQSITFGSLSDLTYGDAAFSVGATAGSGEQVSFSAVAGSSCSVSGSTVTLTGAGTCTVLASQGGNDNYAPATPISQSFNVARRGATAAAGSGAIKLGAAVPSLPCSVSGLLAADAGTVTCTTSVPAITTVGTYATTPVVDPATPPNYRMTLVNGTLNVTYVQQGCFAEPLKPEIPPTTSGITKGATVQVRCTLTNANGVVVRNATGNLRVEDRGPNGTAAPTVVMNVTNVFKLSGDSYTYKLTTSGAGFVKGNFYLVTATWNDGSTTQGWFYLNR